MLGGARQLPGDPDALADETQKERWFRGVVERGELWVAWSGEPQSRKPGEQTTFGTTVTKVGEAGIASTARKCSARARAAPTWAILLVNTAGPGGARHAGRFPRHACCCWPAARRHPTVTYDRSWWDPIGMRATVSHLVRFDGTFDPDENLIGPPGAVSAGRLADALHPALCLVVPRRGRGRV